MGIKPMTSVAIASLYILIHNNAYLTCWFCVRFCHSLHHLVYNHMQQSYDYSFPNS